MGLTFVNHEELSEHPTMATLGNQVNIPIASTTSKYLAKAITPKASTISRKQTRRSYSSRNTKRCPPMSRQHAPFELNNEDLNIGLPQGVKTINLLSNDSEKSEIISYLNTVNRKLDAIIRHFNVPSAELASEMPCHEKNCQSECQNGNMQSQEIKNHSSEVPVSLWAEDLQVPSMLPRTNLGRKDSSKIHHLSPKPILNGNSETTTAKHTFETNTPVSSSSSPVSDLPPMDFSAINIKIPDEIIERLRSRSLNRGNFAKHLVFYLFSPEERRGRNCFGRRAGVQSGPKAPLDPGRLLAVRDMVFQHYPCNAGYEESTWRRECVIAIDTGLRGENRTNLMKQKGSHGAYADER